MTPGIRPLAAVFAWGSMRRLLALLLLASLAGCRQDEPMDPKLQAEGFYIKASAEYLNGKFDLAIKDYQEVKRLDPKDKRIHAALGEVYIAAGKLKEALEEFHAAALENPRRGVNWNRIGYLELQYGRLDAAKDALTKAIGLNPNDFVALEWLGELYEKKSDVQHAVENFRLAAEAAPPSQQARLWKRGEDLLRANDQSLKAQLLLMRARNEGVHDAQLDTDLADLLVRQGDLKGAVDLYQEAAKLNPKDPTLWELVGEIDRKLDKPADAMAAYHESLRIKDRAVVHVALAHLALARKDQAGAQGELASALKAAKGEELREGPELAGLLAELGRKKDALLLYKEAAAEPELEKDLAVQRATAALAKQFGDPATAAAACERIKKAGDTKRCP